MMNTKKMISSAVLAASLTFSTGAAFAWAGCGAGPMMGYGPGCQVGPQEVYPGCQYRTGTLRQGYPCWSYDSQLGARDFRPCFEQKMIYLRDVLNLTDAQESAFKAYFDTIDAYHQMLRSQDVRGQSRQDILNQRLAFQKARVDALQQTLNARQDLLKVLTPEQTKVFEAVEPCNTDSAQRNGFGPGHRRHHHGYVMMSSAPQILGR